VRIEEARKGEREEGRKGGREEGRKGGCMGVGEGLEHLLLPRRAEPSRAEQSRGEGRGGEEA